MDFRLDDSLVDAGIDTVVVGIAKHVDPQAVLPVAFLEKSKRWNNGRSSVRWKKSQNQRLLQAIRICCKR